MIFLVSLCYFILFKTIVVRLTKGVYFSPAHLLLSPRCPAHCLVRYMVQINKHCCFLSSYPQTVTLSNRTHPMKRIILFTRISIQTYSTSSAHARIYHMGPPIEDVRGLKSPNDKALSAVVFAGPIYALGAPFQHILLILPDISPCMFDSDD